MTEREDLDRLGIGVAADPTPLRLPGEGPRSRGPVVLALLLGLSVAALAAVAFVSVR